MFVTFGLMLSTHALRAQSRAIGASGIVLDGGSGYAITILPPPGLNGNYTYTLPPSPGGSITSGYVAMGSAAEQTLFWNGSYWAPSNFLFNTASGISMTGTLSANGGAGTSGQVLEINGAGNPVWANVGGTGTVTSVDVSGGTTGLTTSGGPINGSGTITLTGTLAIASGGTGGTSQSAALNNLLPSQTGNGGLVLMTNGSNVSWAATSGIGTVTSVGVAAPEEFTISNSPITGAGTITIAKANQTANTFWGGPTSGAAAQPTFRALVSADIPDNAANTSGTAATATNATNFTGSLSGDVTGSQSATVVSEVGGSSAANIHAAELAANAATDANTASTLVKRDASGNFSAGTITANLNGNAATSTSSTSSTNFTGSLSGDVTGSQSATVVSEVGGSSAANIHAAELAANAATDANTASTLVKRDGSGDFSAGIITANLNGNATGTASNITGIIAIANGGSGTTTANAALNNFLPLQSGNSGKVLETNGTNSSWQSIGGTGTVTSIDVSGGTTGLTTSGGPVSSSGTITLAGTLGLSHGGTGATTQTGAISNLLPSQSGNNGKVLQTDGTNVSWQNSSGAGTVTSVGISMPSEWTVANSPVTSSGILTITKANQNANTIYAGPVSGGSTAPTFRTLVSADIPDNAANTSGNAATATSATNFTGAFSGDVTGSQSATVVSEVGGSSATNIHAAELAANAATDASTASTIVKRDGSGNFSAGTITANLNGNAATSTSSTTSTSFTGSLSGDVTGSQSATVVSQVGGSSATNIHAAELAANAATATSTASTIVKRDGSGNFSAGTITEEKLSLPGTSTGISSLQAGSQAATINYTLPTSQPSANDVLTATAISGSGPYAVTLGWAAGGGGSSGWGLSGNALAGNEVLGSTNAEPLVIETNGTERMRILSGGNIGIGTATPGEALEVKDGNMLLSNSGTAGQLQLQGTGSGISTFAAGAQGSTTINYTLPTSQGATNSVMQNDGSGNLSWTSMGQILFKRKTNQQDYDYTYLVSDTNLFVTLAANATYTFDAFLSFSDPGTNGNSAKIAFTVPAGCTLKFGVNDAESSLNGVPTVVNTSGTSTTTLALYNDAYGVAETFVFVEGIVISGSTSGDLQLKCARVGGAANLRLNENSYLKLTRIK